MINGKSNLKFRRSYITIALVLGCSAWSCAESDTPDTSEGIASREQAVVQDCSQILADGIYDTVKLSTHSKSDYALSKGFCDEVKKSASGGGKTSFWYGAIGGRLSAHASRSFYEKYCAYFNETASSDESLNLLTTTADPNIVAAWAECVTDNGGLACYQEPGQNTIGLTYEEMTNAGNLKAVSLVPTNMKITNPKDASPTLFIGDTHLVYTVTNAAKDATLVLNGRTEATNFAQSCSVLVKSQVLINRDLNDAWGQLAEDFNKLMSSMDALIAASKKNTKLFEVDVTNVARLQPLKAAIKSQYDNAKAHQNLCSDTGTRCVTPNGSDLAITGTMPNVTCTMKVTDPPQVKKFPGVKYDFNVLDLDLSKSPFKSLGTLSSLYHCQAD